MSTAIFLMMMVIWKAELSRSETPYHYITQVSESPALTLSPKPLFSPHDSRREGNGRNEFGLKIIGSGVSGTSTLKPLFANVENKVYGDQGLWYPVYADVQYPGWVSLSQTPVLLSYGELPEGYAPSVPVKGDPLGYSFSYQTSDHARHESSDGRGNFFSSFSFIPPADSIGLQPYGKQVPTGTVPSVLHQGIQTSDRPRTVHIPSRRPTTTATASPPVNLYKPSTPSSFHRTQSNIPNPFDVPTARPLVKTRPGSYSEDDFTNGFNFESKKLHTTRLPQTAFTLNHALSTNIQYRNRESSTRSPSQGVRAVTILPSDSNPSSPTSTQRSYQALSRSLPLAFSSQRDSTVPPSLITSYSTEKSFSPSPLLPRIRTNKISADNELRSSSRRSTTESIALRFGLQRSSTFPSATSKKPSVIQKIPRKLDIRNETAKTEESVTHPRFIDDLTVLAYSSEIDKPMNNSIIQIKPRKDNKIFSNLPESTLLKSVNGVDVLRNASKTYPDTITKDGYMSGNQTYLGGIGLSSNIHH